jgi:hypothetical protein
MKELVEQVDVKSGPGGTEIRLSVGVGRAQVGTGPVSVPAATPISETRSLLEVTRLSDDVDLCNGRRCIARCSMG